MRPIDDLLCRLTVVTALTFAFTSTQVTSHPFLRERFSTDLPRDFSRFENEQLSDPSYRSVPDVGNQEPISLEDVLNHKLNGPPAMCPRQNVILFFLTGNVKYLRPCMRDNNQTTNSLYSGSETETEATPEYAREAENEDEQEDLSYSGRLLKRILQNMNDGTVKVDYPRLGVTRSKKRARLSINSALTSLSDMLQQESGRHHSTKPLYGFHSKLLKMG